MANNTIIKNDEGALRLLDAIYEQAGRDYLHMGRVTQQDWRTADAFLPEGVKARLRALNEK